MQSTNQLDPSTLNSLLNNANGSGSSLIPQSLTNAISIGFVVINVISIAFLVVYIISIIRKWKVQSAVLHMQKDIAEIKLALAPKQPTHPDSVQTPPQPGDSSRMIATNHDDSTIGQA